MHKILKSGPLIVALFIVTLAVTARSEAEWIAVEEIYAHMGEDGVTPVTDEDGYWAGELTEIEVNDDDGEPTGRVKVQITWITDRTDYRCHQVYHMKMKDLKDFTHRSLAMKKCQ